MLNSHIPQPFKTLWRLDSFYLGRGCATNPRRELAFEDKASGGTAALAPLGASS
jgi:hypothetical protein